MNKYSFCTYFHTCLLIVLTKVTGAVAEPDSPSDQVGLAYLAYLNQFAVHVPGGTHAARDAAREAMLIFKGQIGSLEDYYLFELPDSDDGQNGEEENHRRKRSSSPSFSHHKLLSDHPSVKWFEQQTALSRPKRDFLSREHNTTLFRQKREFNPLEEGAIAHLTDPQWSAQWYLDAGGQGGHDMNVIAAWREGVTGRNISVSIIDDGLDHSHPDLRDNYDPLASYDMNSHDFDPMPTFNGQNDHGTRCAGEVAAKGNNSICITGVAPNSKIGGIRLLDGVIHDAAEAASLGFHRDHVDVYSASWGPDDDGRKHDGPGLLAIKAFVDGVTQGRGQRGCIYVWASGNGGPHHDSCATDGYSSSIYTVTVGGVSQRGIKPWYLEECAAVLTSTYSSGNHGDPSVTTTDTQGGCTNGHTGTSASAPMAAGIVALALEANPRLTWRDVQYVTLMTSRSQPIRDGEWEVNGVGRKVSHRYGYGLMDAHAMVNMSRYWSNVPEKFVCSLDSNMTTQSLSGPDVYTLTVNSSGCQGSANEINYLEHVEVEVDLESTVRGSTALYLTSPAGTRSTMLPHRRSDTSPGRFNRRWPFMSVFYWGEGASGVWTLEVDTLLGNNNILSGWILILHGTRGQPVQLRSEAWGPPTRPPPRTTPQTAPTSTPAAPDCSRGCSSRCVCQHGGACPTGDEGVANGRRNCDCTPGFIGRWCEAALPSGLGVIGDGSGHGDSGAGVAIISVTIVAVVLGLVVTIWVRYMFLKRKDENQSVYDSMNGEGGVVNLAFGGRGKGCIVTPEANATHNAGLNYQVDQHISTDTAPPPSDTAHTNYHNEDSPSAEGQGQTSILNESAVYDNAAELSYPTPQRDKGSNTLYDNFYGEVDRSAADTQSFGQVGHQRFDCETEASPTDVPANKATVPHVASQHAPQTQTGSGRRLIMPPLELLMTSQAHQDSHMTSSRSNDDTRDTVELVKS